MGGVREFDAWLETPVVEAEEPNRKKTAEDVARERDATAARLRFRSLWLDMRQHIEEQEFGHQVNRWRLAAYAVWYATPRELRPVQFQKELARQLGMADDENFRKWRRQFPALFNDDSVRATINSLIMERMPDVMLAAIRSATQEGYQGHQDRKMLAEIAGVYKPRQISQVEGGEKPLKIEDDTLNDEQRAARIDALLERARARRAGQAAEG